MHSLLEEIGLALVFNQVQVTDAVHGLFVVLIVELCQVLVRQGWLLLVLSHLALLLQLNKGVEGLALHVS